MDPTVFEQTTGMASYSADPRKKVPPLAFPSGGRPGPGGGGGQGPGHEGSPKKSTGALRFDPSTQKGIDNVLKRGADMPSKQALMLLEQHCSGRKTHAGDTIWMQKCLAALETFYGRFIEKQQMMVGFQPLGGLSLRPRTLPSRSVAACANARVLRARVHALTSSSPVIALFAD
jgi:hypothetical protein